MKPTGGLYLDCLPQEQPEGTYRYAENVVLTDGGNALTNERGFQKLVGKYGYLPVGCYAIGPDAYVLLWAHDGLNTVTNYDCEIGVWEQGAYRMVLHTSDLQVHPHHPAKVRLRTNHGGERIIVATDGRHRPWMLNLDNAGLSRAMLPPKREVDRLRLFPDVEMPQLTTERWLKTTGSILGGSYTLMLAYELDTTATTQPLGPFGNFLIGSGKDIDALSGEGIRGQFTHLDTRYDYLRLYAIRDRNGARSAHYIRRLPIPASGMVSFSWLGDTIEPVAVESLLIERGHYLTAGTLELLEERLYLADLTTYPHLDYQPYANAIRVTWCIDKGDNPDFPQVLPTEGSFEAYGQLRGFCPSATYALYVGFTLRSGGETPYYHIPGREALDNEPFLPLFQYDPVLEPQYQPLRNCDVRDFGYPTTALSGELSVHRNEDEFYPDSARWDVYNGISKVGTLRGKHVRHHRMPSAFTINRQAPAYAYGWAGFDLGLQFSNIYLPPELAASVSGIRFAFAVREFADMDVVAFVPVLTKDFTQQATTSATALQQPLRGYDFTMMLKKPRLSNLFVVTEFDNNAYVDSKLLGSAASQPNVSRVSSKSIQYLPANNSLVDNEEREDAFHLEASGVYAGSAGGRLFTGTIGLSQPGVQVPYSSIRQVKRNLYAGFTERSLVQMGGVISVEGSGVYRSKVLFSGDMTVQAQTIRYMQPYRTIQGGFNFTDNATDYKSTGSLTFVSWSRLPVSKRYDDAALTPLLKAATKKYAGEYLNQYLLQPSYEMVNTFKTLLAAADGMNQVHHFPKRIIRSVVQNGESRVSGWRTFLPQDYYEHLKGGGRIMNLQRHNSTLLIHSQTRLHRTVGRQQLSTDQLTVYLGTGDLFAMEPEEILDTQEGYAGTQHRLSCQLTKAGYAFIDQQMGKVFLLSQSLEEISAYGLRDWFARNLPFRLLAQQTRTGWTGVAANDAPIAPEGIGFTLGYEEENNRLLLTKRDWSLIDDDLWGKPEDILNGLQAGKYYMQNGLLFRASQPTPPVPYDYQPTDDDQEMAQMKIISTTVTRNGDNWRVKTHVQVPDVDGLDTFTYLIWQGAVRIFSATGLTYNSLNGLDADLPLTVTGSIGVQVLVALSAPIIFTTVPALPPVENPPVGEVPSGGAPTETALEDLPGVNALGYNYDINTRSLNLYFRLGTALLSPQIRLRRQDETSLTGKDDAGTTWYSGIFYTPKAASIESYTHTLRFGPTGFGSGSVLGGITPGIYQVAVRSALQPLSVRSFTLVVPASNVARVGLYARQFPALVIQGAAYANPGVTVTTAGGDTTALEYALSPILGWQSSPVFTLPEAYRVNCSLTVQVRQSGIVVSTPFVLGNGTNPQPQAPSTGAAAGTEQVIQTGTYQAEDGTTQPYILVKRTT